MTKAFLIARNGFLALVQVRPSPVYPWKHEQVKLPAHDRGWGLRGGDGAAGKIYISYFTTLGFSSPVVAATTGKKNLYDALSVFMQAA